MRWIHSVKELPPEGLEWRPPAFHICVWGRRAALVNSVAAPFSGIPLSMNIPSTANLASQFVLSERTLESIVAG